MCCVISGGLDSGKESIGGLTSTASLLILEVPLEFLCLLQLRSILSVVRETPIFYFLFMTPKVISAISVFDNNTILRPEKIEGKRTREFQKNYRNI